MSLGVTPTGKTLDAIKKALQGVYNAGNSAGYNSGYSAGLANGDKTHTVQAVVAHDWANDKNGLAIYVDGACIHDEYGQWQARSYTFTV